MIFGPTEVFVADNDLARQRSVEAKGSSVKPRPAMALIDLNGRQDEPAIRRLLEQSHGSAEAFEEARAHYRSGEWTFIGWHEGDEILACAGAEKLGSGTIGIRSITVASAWRNRGLGRALIDALAERAGAKRVVAETDDDAVGFYRRCGFAVEDAPPKFGRARHWCVREVSNERTAAAHLQRTP